MRIQPNQNYTMGIGYPKLNKNCIYKAELATNQPDYIEQGKVFVKDILLDKNDYRLVISLNVELLEDELPHGSGIDCEWSIVDKGKYFRCCNWFHAMDNNGYYIGYSEFSLIIPKKNPREFKLHFHGDYSQYLNRRNMLREYLNDLFYWSLFDLETKLKGELK